MQESNKAKPAGIANKEEKLHKIILRQSELIEKQVDEKTTEKKDLMMMIRNQAKTIEECLAKRNAVGKGMNNSSMKMSIDLESYLMSSVNYAEANR